MRLKALEFSGCRTRRGLPSPGGAADHAAEIAAPKRWILIGKNIGFHVAESRLRLVLDAVIERLDDVFLELCRTRVGMHHRLALGIAEFGITEAKHVHFNTDRHECHDRVHVLGMPGVVCKAIAVQTVSISCCAMPWLRRKSW